MNTSISKLAWRNLWRHKRRTQLLLAVVAYATIAIIFFWGFYDGFVNVLLSGQARYLSAPVMIQSEAYRNDPDPTNGLAGLDFETQLSSFEGVRGVAPRLEFPSLMRSPYRTMGAQMRGIDPALESQVSDLPNHIAEGRMLETTGEIVLGIDLAKELDVRIGERLAVDVQSLAGAQSAGLEVVGLIDSNIDPVDKGIALVDLEEARALTGVSTATGLALDVKQGQEKAVAKALNQASVLPQGVTAYPISELLGGLMAGIETKRGSMIPIILIIAGFAAVTVMSTVIVSVIERTREFGVISSLGLNQGQLARMVTLEATYTTLIGFAAGAIVGFSLNAIMSATNLMGPLIHNVYGRFLTGMALSDKFVFAVGISYLAWAATTVVIAAVLAIIVPGRRVRNLNPSEAMRAV
ncbi:MAG: ABC transporter permease [Trueperaceae bacterium]|nr:ABC transporter permease [Trueperaceae bacterium]